MGGGGWRERSGEVNLRQKEIIENKSLALQREQRQEYLEDYVKKKNPAK